MINSDIHIKKDRAYAMGPLTGYFFLLLRGRLSQRGQGWLVPAAQVHLRGAHKGQLLHQRADLGFLFAGKQRVSLLA